MIFSVMTVMMIARKMVETMRRRSWRSTSIGRAGSTSAIASLVISVMMPSVGAISTLTPKAGADAREAGRQPGQRMAPDAHEGGGAERDEDQVAGVGGDAREDADEHDDERQQPRGRDLDEHAG